MYQGSPREQYTFINFLFLYCFEKGANCTHNAVWYYHRVTLYRNHKETLPPFSFECSLICYVPFIRNSPRISPTWSFRDKTARSKLYYIVLDLNDQFYEDIRNFYSPEITLVRDIERMQWVRGRAFLVFERKATLNTQKRKDSIIQTCVCLACRVYATRESLECRDLPSKASNCVKFRWKYIFMHLSLFKESLKERCLILENNLDPRDEIINFFFSHTSWCNFICTQRQIYLLSQAI